MQCQHTLTGHNSTALVVLAWLQMVCEEDLTRYGACSTTGGELYTGTALH